MSHGADNPPVAYFTIWIYLVALVVIGVALLVAPFSHTLSVVLIFSVALVKAVLVLRHYMHVREVPTMLYAMIGIPIVLAIIMVFLLMPDIGYHDRGVSHSSVEEAHH